MTKQGKIWRDGNEAGGNGGWVFGEADGRVKNRKNEREEELLYELMRNSVTAVFLLDGESFKWGMKRAEVQGIRKDKKKQSLQKNG